MQIDALAAMTTSSTKPAASNEGFVLCLPGQKLDVSLLINKKKKFRNRGGRDGAMAAMRKLDEDGLGKLIMRKSKGSIRVSRVIVVGIVFVIAIVAVHVVVANFIHYNRHGISLKPKFQLIKMEN